MLSHAIVTGVYILPNKGHNGWGKKSGILNRGRKISEKKRGRGKKKVKGGKRREKREKKREK